MAKSSRFLLLPISLSILVSQYCFAEPLRLEGGTTDLLGLYTPGSFLVFGEDGAEHTRSCGSSGETPVPGSFLASPETRFGTWNPSFGIWSVCGDSYSVTRKWGLPGDMPVPADYNGDSLTDYGVFRPNTGEWYIAYNGGSIVNGAVQVVQYGTAGDYPVPADYDGDGKADLALFRQDSTTSGATWKITLSSTASEREQPFGLVGDLPVPADYDGDGSVNIAVWRPADGTWYVLAPDGSTSSQQFGLPEDVPSPADLDNDGKADFVVYRPNLSKWFVLGSIAGSSTAQYSFGELGARPLTRSMSYLTDRVGALDYDGDRVSDLALVRANTSGALQFLVCTGTSRSHPLTGTLLGSSGDTVIPGDYDGDGVTDPAVVTKSDGYYNWLFLLSSKQENSRTLLTVTYGLDDDQLLPADYDGDGKTDLAVVRDMPDGTKLWIPNASGESLITPVTWGLTSDTAFTADVDGDLRSDFIVVREEEGELQWIIRSASGAVLETKLWGFVGDEPLVGDFNGDGKAEVGVVRLLNGYRMVLIDGLAPYYWGLTSDRTLHGNYAGSKAMSSAVWRVSNGQGYFFVRNSPVAGAGLAFGVTGDFPLSPAGPTNTSTSSTGSTAAKRISCATRSLVNTQEEGFNWSPVGSSSGTLLVTFGSSLTGTVQKVALVSSLSTGDVVLETLTSAGTVDGKQTFKGALTGSEYPDNVIMVRRTSDSTNSCITVMHPGQDY